jgi:hypothetical protein
LYSEFSFSILCFLILSIGACTNKQDYTPEYSTYIKETELMLNISEKFAFEPDAKKLNKVAVATQQSGVRTCTDFNRECNLFGEFLSNTIKFSQDGILTTEERKKLEINFNQLTAAIKEGRFKLKQNQK